MTPEVSVRPAQAGDDVASVIKAAFGDEGDRIAALWADLASGESLRASLVALVEGEVVGHVGVSHTWVDARRRLVDAWLLGPLAVAPASQGRGAGSALVRAAVQTAAAAGAPLVFLEGDPDYYSRLGFERASSLGFTAPSNRTPDPAFQVARLDGYEEWMTGRVVYHDVWWRHDAAGLREPELSAAQRRLEEQR